MINFTEIEKTDNFLPSIQAYNNYLQETEELAQIEVLNEICKQIDQEIFENLEKMYEEEITMSMHEKGLNNF